MSLIRNIPDPNWQADLVRYPPDPFYREQSIWAIYVYRFGRRTDLLPAGFRRRMLTNIYWILFRFFETVLGIGIQKAVTIGPGLRIFHFGNIFVHPDVVIGANCTLRQGVTIGNREPGGAVPVIGDNVEFGAYAQVLGGVRIGNNCRVGAMSVLLCDLPDGATAVGVPARVVTKGAAVPRSVDTRGEK